MDDGEAWQHHQLTQKILETQTSSAALDLQGDSDQDTRFFICVEGHRIRVKHLKQWAIAEPETKILRIATDDEFLILASDGLWDKVRNAKKFRTEEAMRQIVVAVVHYYQISISLSFWLIHRSSIDEGTLFRYIDPFTQ
ncbi:hypothetical protein CRG98_023881 [Punica granatum]|uniref:PPM-type phosphatase domain-containing protein n=1 Tax=Punica granatum TaxID=22663 RepID=A0A2I0JHK9_PUNGR|nr:hypothetical protein CRG98_023881 [Punica granatum]